MKTDAGNAEEQASELCESVNWCRSREKGRILVEFDCGERRGKKWDSESDRESCLVRDRG